MDTKIAILKNRLLFKMAGMDPQYAAMSNEYDKLQEAFEKLTYGMREEDKDVAWGFVCTSDDMNWHMVALICEWFDIKLSDIVKKADSLSENRMQSSIDDIPPLKGTEE